MERFPSLGLNPSSLFLIYLQGSNDHLPWSTTSRYIVCYKTLEGKGKGNILKDTETKKKNQGIEMFTDLGALLE